MKILKSIPELAIEKAAAAAVRVAIRVLRRGEFDGEAARLLSMSQSWRLWAEQKLIDNWPRIKNAPAKTALKQLSSLVRLRCLQAELNIRKT